MDDTTLAKLRGDVINRTINIETIMSSIITQHYFGRIVKGFFIDVLYDEGFSWRLKCSILRKIIENPDKQKLNELDRVSGIRNRFAHYGIQMSKDSATAPTDVPFEILDHRKGELGVDFEKLHREFKSLANSVEQYLAQVYQDMGGEMYTADAMIFEH